MTKTALAQDEGPEGQRVWTAFGFSGGSDGSWWGDVPFTAPGGEGFIAHPLAPPSEPPLDALVAIGGIIPSPLTAALPRFTAPRGSYAFIKPLPETRTEALARLARQRKERRRRARRETWWWRALSSPARWLDRRAARWGRRRGWYRPDEDWEDEDDEW